MKHTTSYQTKKEKLIMISLVTQLLKVEEEVDSKVLVVLIVPHFQTFLRIFLVTLVVVHQEELATEETT